VGVTLETERHGLPKRGNSIEEGIDMVLSFDRFREFDRLANEMFGSVGASATAAMPMDLYRSGDHFVLHCDLAGVDPESVDINVDGRVLTIRAERTARTDTDVHWLRRERATGTFERRLSMGDGLDLENIAATWDQGVLTLTIPVAEKAKPRRIQINSGNEAPQQVLEGSAQDTTAISTS
jgi:HSP20 family protein